MGYKGCFGNTIYGIILFRLQTRNAFHLVERDLNLYYNRMVSRNFQSRLSIHNLPISI